MSTFYNVHYIEQHEGLGYGSFRMMQFNDYGIKDRSERRAAAMSLAEELAASGKPVVVKEVLHGTRCNSLVWQSFSAANDRGLLER